MVLVLLGVTAAPALADTPDDEAEWRCTELSPLADESETAREIIRACDEAIAAHGENAVAPLTDLYLSRGVALRRLGEMQASIEDLTQALEIDATATAYRMRAWTYREMKRYEAAERDLTTSLELDDHWQGHLSRCVVRLDLNRPEAALPDCERTLLMRASEDSLYFASLALTRTGSPQRAIAVLERGFMDGRSSDRMVAGLVIALRALGREEQAARSLARGRRDYPGSALLAGL